MYRLINIQQKLKAPKNQKNTFGGYNYRSAEDILEAVKPLLAENKTVLIIKDEINQVGDRYYVKATATLYGDDGKEIAQSSAFAREEENKKGQDGSQITGATSSYARKYALNGLFAIDDTKDADATNTHNKEVKPVTKPKDLNPDFDIIEGIKAVSDLKNLEIYYKKYKDEVKDVPAFNRTINKQKDVIQMKGN